ncbi:hypothetical protein GCM10010174_18420 [Kutzneria viridogrisea]|uniref:4'-phosphopantetheinyl transferase domain-containing protein n=2 Tax=Kutzneria TaxID=43356 RepID=W5WFG0_9PSEU|nr:4'-phosphopantetheinyl transferase superfamily protein [Kutzneria albida]AHH99582.1 hypothetical protein KALB_6222 [Kutzneria albida DSM 43870]MBA8922863.1 4'-phosphopantetheinyl transferase [Kutzneria viridogrisea]
MSSTWVADTVKLAFARVTETSTRLATEEDRRAGAEQAAWRQREYLAARALLRGLLTELADLAAARASLSADEAGRPFLLGRPDLAVSLSHEDGWVAAAVAVGQGARVGVDVQVPVQGTDLSLINRCCGPRARAELAAMPGERRDHEFAWIWSVQEACVKAEGTGLAGRPWTVPVEVGGTAGRWGDYHWRSLRDRAPIPLSCAYRQVGG